MIDWRRNKELLLKDSEQIIRALFADNKKKKDVIAAIGYVFEFGGGEWEFEICANTARNAKESLAEYLAKWPDGSADEFRWNSGNYDYPAAVQVNFCGWSDSWLDELDRLNQLAQDEKHRKRVHKGVTDICCNVLAELATRGILGDWSAIDFNVSSQYEENFAQVKRRDRRIRKIIKSNAEPKG